MPLRRVKVLIDELEETEYKFRLLCLGETVEFRRHLGGGMHLYIFNRNDQMVYTRGEGITMSKTEWIHFVRFFRRFPDLHPDIENEDRCGERTDYSNQMGFWQCPECNPYSYLDY